MRPDGTDRSELTRTAEYHEAGVRFSPDGKKILYYRMPRSEAVDNNTYGTFDLVIADADGRNAVVHGRDFPWASWGPDGSRAGLPGPERHPHHRRGHGEGAPQDAPQGDRPAARLVARRSVVRGHGQRAGPVLEHRPAEPDGRVDQSPSARPNGTIARPTGCPTRGASSIREASCRSPAGTPRSGWRAATGRDRRMLYASETQHLYGGCASPDGKYLLFTRSDVDLGPVDNSRTSMAIVRMADTPIVAGPGTTLRKQYPDAHRGTHARPRSGLGAALDLRRARAGRARRTLNGSGWNDRSPTHARDA